MKKKTQMKKTNVENFKEVTHEIEFMLFSDLVLLTVIMWKIGYEKARDLLHNKQLSISKITDIAFI